MISFIHIIHLLFNKVDIFKLVGNLKIMLCFSDQSLFFGQKQNLPIVHRFLDNIVEESFEFRSVALRIDR